MTAAEALEDAIDAALTPTLEEVGFELRDFSVIGPLYVREADDVLEMIQVQYSPPGGAWESMNEAVASGAGVMPPLKVTANLGVHFRAIDRLLERPEIDYEYFLGYDLSTRIGETMGNGMDLWWVLGDTGSFRESPSLVQRSDPGELAQLFAAAVVDSGLSWFDVSTDPATVLEPGFRVRPVVALEIAAYLGDRNRAAEILEVLSTWSDAPEVVRDRVGRAAHHLGLEP